MKKPAPRKSAPGKKAPAKKAGAKKATAKKATVKKSAAKKSPAKKTAAKKTGPKKTGLKKASLKKTVAKKAPARKVPAAAKKKAAAKKIAPAGTPARRKAPAKAVPEGPAQKALAVITRCLDDSQAENVAVIDLAGKSVMADYLVIASGRNPRHIGAMAQNLREKIKALNGVSPPIEGMASAEWVLVDQGDVVVHLFRPETRQLYNLEKMWGEALASDDEGADPRRI